MSTTTRRFRRRCGLSLAEVLIAGTIAAMLLISIATAYDASSQSIQVNDRFTRAAQIARLTVRNLVEDCRRAEACQVGPSALQSQAVVADQTTLDVIRPDGTVISYAYDADARQLTMTINDPTNPVTAIVARDVEMCRFTGEVEPHPDTGIRRTIRVMIELQIQVDDQPLYLSGSAVPRREMVYMIGEDSAESL